ncbi:hypothetical protein [Breoghania sp.]|uniref:hypothetical protein n=1 Tax=Breoghania sp. TaxID=2065378 RepID=UPI002AA71781|nr:hypothetical protein [Breoghania sp.]
MLGTPTFSRVEIRHATVDQINTAASALEALATEIRKLAQTVADENLRDLAVHAAIRKTSNITRASSDTEKII